MTTSTTDILPPRVIGSARLLAGLETGRADLEHHLWSHGPAADLNRATYERFTAAVGLRGRGGAGFPVAAKLADLPSRGIAAVVVNGSESEPVSRKDRLLMTFAPHLVLDGAVGLAHALRAPSVIVAVHDRPAAYSLRQAIAERRDGIEVRITATPGTFVAGEARAVLRGLTGDVAVPPGRRILPTRKGYDGRPTFLSNVETFAQLAVLARLGPREFSSNGVVDEPGTQLLTVAGDVQRPGVIETPTGVRLDTVLGSSGAANGSSVLVGGYHGQWVPQPDRLTLSRLSDVPIGAGIVVALGPQTCPLGEVRRVAAWLAEESAGQCGPCVFGLGSLVADLDRLIFGDRQAWHDVTRHLELVSGRGACAHPDGASRFVASALEVHRDDVRAHLERGGCGRDTVGILPTQRVEQ